MGYRAPKLDITYEQMRSLLMETLRGDWGNQLTALNHSIPPVALRLGLMKVPMHLPEHDRRGEALLSPADFACVQNVIWDLIIEGIIRPGLNDGNNNNFPFFHVTERGKQILADGPQAPYDPDGYLKRLTSETPDLDPVIITYLNESLHTFRINCLLSSTIALGCASEKALLLLIDFYADSLPNKMQDKFRKDTEGRMIKRQWDEFRKMLDSELRTRLPRDLADGLDVELNAIFDFIRNQRNDAGHPTGKTIERERAYANLVVFPVYLRKVYALIEWLKANPKS
jgi:hypothetical protein